MGYYANGDGHIHLKPQTTAADIDTLATILEDAGFNITDVTAEQPGTFSLVYNEYSWDEDIVTTALNQITPYIDAGHIAFEGEDGGAWRYRLEDNEWVLYDAQTFFVCDLPVCSKAACVYQNGGKCYAGVIFDNKDITPNPKTDDSCESYVKNPVA